MPTERWITVNHPSTLVKGQEIKLTRRYKSETGNTAPVVATTQGIFDSWDGDSDSFGSIYLQGRYRLVYAGHGWTAVELLVKGPELPTMAGSVVEIYDPGLCRDRALILDSGNRWWDSRSMNVVPAELVDRHFTKVLFDAARG